MSDNIIAEIGIESDYLLLERILPEGNPWTKYAVIYLYPNAILVCCYGLRIPVYILILSASWVFFFFVFVPHFVLSKFLLLGKATKY